MSPGPGPFNEEKRAVHLRQKQKAGLLFKVHKKVKKCGEVDPFRPRKNASVKSNKTAQFELE